MTVDMNLEKRKSFLSLTEDDVTHLKNVRLELKELAPGFIDRFYDHLMTFPELRRLLPDQATIERLKSQQSAYFASLIAGDYSERYMQERLHIGHVHARIGLSPSWYLGAYSHYLTQLLPALHQKLGPNSDAFVPALQALLKVLLLDIGLAIDSYVLHRDDLIAHLRDYSATFAQLPYGTLVATPDLQVVFANHAFEELFELPLHSLNGTPLGDVMNIGELQDLADRAMAEGKSRLETGLSRLGTPVGKQVPVVVSASRLPMVEGQDEERVLFVVEDLREKARLSQELLNAQAVAGVGSWHYNGLTKEVTLTPQAHHLYGWPIDKAFDFQSLLSCVHPDDRELVQVAWKKGMKEGQYHVEHRVGGSAGGNRMRWIEAQGKLECNPEGELINGFGTIRDITERKLAEHSIQRLAFYDKLTGLPNRMQAMVLLQQALDEASRNGQTSALLCLDLDRLKEINDTEGLSMGDHVLRETVHRFESVLPPGVKLCRVGGDEFILTLKHPTTAAVTRLAEQLIHVGLKPFEHNGRNFHVGLSVGIAIYPQDGKTPEELLRNADIAMSSAKSTSGTGLMFYESNMSAQLQRRIAMGQKLETALRTGQLMLHYQPQVFLRSHHLSGLEALARWHDEEWGWISPGEFIPVAEERGLIVELGDWAISEAARQVRHWRDAGLDLRGRVAVNVAAPQMAHDDFATRVLALTREAGVAPSSLELELTESAVMHDPSKALDMAKELVSAGFTLSIDDFGTGYSSLAQLKHFPVSKVKIDMSFVKDMMEDGQNMAIVNAIVSMAKALHLHSVAEGVERADQSQALCDMGCEIAQGYHFSRPLKAEDVAAHWLKAHQP